MLTMANLASHKPSSGLLSDGRLCGPTFDLCPMSKTVRYSGMYKRLDGIIKVKVKGIISCNQPCGVARDACRKA